MAIVPKRSNFSNILKYYSFISTVVIDQSGDETRFLRFYFLQNVLNYLTEHVDRLGDLSLPRLHLIIIVVLDLIHRQGILPQHGGSRLKSETSQSLAQLSDETRDCDFRRKRANFFPI